MPNAQGALIHQFLTRHPIGRAIANHTKYGPGHPAHDAHAQAETANGGAGVQSVSPTLMRTAHGPINPMLMRQLMQSGAPGGPGGAPLPLPGQGGPPPMPQGGMPGPAGPPPGPPPMPGR